VISLTVVVPTRNRGELIGDTLVALLGLDVSSLGRVEVLVVDQSTDERTRQEVQKIDPAGERLRHVRSASVGSSAARNAGAAIARGEVLAYTDDDCIVDPGWLKALAEEFADPSVTAVYGRLLPYDFKSRNGLEVGFQPSEWRTVFEGRTPPWYIGHGGNMAFRRSALLAAGGFDPMLGAGGRFQACEDPDIAFRLLARGRRVVYCPTAVAYHKHWKDWPAQQRMERAYGIGAGAQFGKYVRCGDAYGMRLLATWVWQLGVRRLGAGLLKWRSRRVMYLGYCQLVYPWFGLLRSLRCRVDATSMCYVDA
jgi:cellulose synthase/poly-beta-1,6-N-acetylglucosamine synthase-like glycosyltransferase